MNEKDIVRLAEEAELWLHSDRDYAKVEKFANLVAAEEREACANAVSHALYGQNGCGKAIDAIRARGK